jgi:AraC-like DNA-binding protein
MIWTTLFSISIAQGIFLILLIAVKKTVNPLAARLLAAMVALMVLTNFGYVVIRTELLQYIPFFFALPFGMVFLFGPLFYFYANALTQPSFKFKHWYWLHALPYCIQLLINIPVITAPQAAWNPFIHTFLAGNLYMRPAEKIILLLQDVHLFIYLFITFRKIKTIGNAAAPGRYIISINVRVKWLQQLSVCFYLFLLTVFGLYIYLITRGRYNPVTNYGYTLVTSGIIYFIAFKAVLYPDAISPGFAQKYKAYMQFDGTDGSAYMRRLTTLMTGDKIFTNPRLKLSGLSAQVGLPPHQLSKLINEKFGKSFNDYVNEYRVQEFIRRVNEDKNRTYTIYGMALDVGFNSKSSFNVAFKKITGKNPSHFRPAP